MIKQRLTYTGGMVGFVLLLSLVLMIPAQEASASGTCTQEDIDDGWICISSKDDLEQVSNNLSGKYKLASDIDLSSVLDWTPLGDYSAEEPFNGKFDGNGYVILGMNISGNDSYQGLFGYTQLAEISNVRLIDVQIDVSGSASFVGSLIGIADEGTVIANTHVTGSITATKDNDKIGGLVGDATGTEIKNSSFSGTVEGGELVGGLVGQQSTDSLVEGSYVAADVTGRVYVGGLVGRSYGYILLSSFSGIVEGMEVVGGLSGYQIRAMEQSYATGRL